MVAAALATVGTALLPQQTCAARSPRYPGARPPRFLSSYERYESHE